MLAINTVKSILYYITSDIEDKIQILDNEIESSWYCFSNNHLIQQRLELLKLLSKLNDISNLLKD